MWVGMCLLCVGRDVSGVFGEVCVWGGRCVCGGGEVCVLGLCSACVPFSTE